MCIELENLKQQRDIQALYAYYTVKMLCCLVDVMPLDSLTQHHLATYLTSEGIKRI